MKYLNWFITAILVVVIGGLAFVHLSPDYNIYMVRSGSMSPTINTGDMILSGPAMNLISGGIKNGAIVTYQYGEELITHRVVSLADTNVTTKGDAAEDPDPWSVARADIKGVYLFKIPSIGYLLNFVRTKSGWFSVIIMPSALLLALLVREIVKEALSSC